jgi:hypothetical protein
LSNVQLLKVTIHGQTCQSKNLKTLLHGEFLSRISYKGVVNYEDYYGELPFEDSSVVPLLASLEKTDECNVLIPQSLFYTNTDHMNTLSVCLAIYYVAKRLKSQVFLSIKIQNAATLSIQF